MFVLKDRKVELTNVVFSPDGTMLAAFGLRGTLQLWDLANRQLVWKASMEPYFRAAFFARDGQSLYLLEDESGVQRFDVARGFLILPTPPIDCDAYGAASDGKQVFLCTSEFASEGFVLRCHQLPDGEEVWATKVPGTVGHVAMSLSRSGQTLAFGMPAGIVVLLDSATGARLGDVGENGPGVASVALSPDGQTVAWCAVSNLYLRRLDRADTIRHKLGRTHFSAVACHPSGDFFATANGDGKVDTWDAQSGERRESFDWKIGKLHDVVFDASGDRAACCSKTGEIVVWDVDR